MIFHVQIGYLFEYLQFRLRKLLIYILISFTYFKKTN